MATFTVNGYEIRSDLGNQVAETKLAELQFVAPLGEATLDVRYLSDGPTSAEVSLANYNLLLNGLHLNDGVLPDRIEMFNATWTHEDGTTETSRVFNVAYSDTDGWQDFLFAIGQAGLPDFRSIAAANNMLKGADYNVLEGADAGNTFTIQLENMPGVSVSGVIRQMFEAEALDPQAKDHFDFSYDADSMPPDMTEFDIAARAEQVDLLNPDPEPTSDPGTVPDDDLPNQDTLPGYDDFAG
ncbi:hypothetical protein [uncultured Litoreibacter sp.]|uniref:hypothetical protein n=1 Tax=uncultured Litoreibacter sp. TaxID=1392394 RepID=UPI0026129C75|nr:hypothetical protein [uncultured Litoreibacter sp.]